MPPNPSTVTEAVQWLTANGYTDELGPRGAETPADADHVHEPASLIIEHVFRFEGDSDPGDEAIVLGVYCDGCDIRGIVVSAFGPDADPKLMERLRHHS